MWTWERERRRQVQEPSAQLGVITLGGAESAANLGSERRWLRVCTPGGMQWMPRQGEQVLVLKNGEDAWVLGVLEEETDLRPGQTGLKGENCSLVLGDRVEISGEVTLDGQPLRDYVRDVVSQMLDGG